MTLRNYSSTAAQTTLAAGVDSSTSLLTVSATTGFPAVPFILAVDAGASAQELVLVTNVAGTNLTVTRGYDSTVAVSHDTGAVVSHSHGGIDFREANTHVNASSGVHGATGDVVGTTDTQTLTSKTVTLGSNTISGTKAQFNTALTDGDFAYASDLTARPQGVLGYAQVTANQGGITTAVDLTGLTVTVTVGSGRRIKVTGDVYYSTTVAGGAAGVYVNEGASQLAQRTRVTAGTLADASRVEVVLTPSAGAHTYKLRGSMGSGTGTLEAAATYPAYILVEDLGSA